MYFKTRNVCLFYHLLLFWVVIHIQADSCTKKEIFILVAKGHRLKKCVMYETQVSSLLQCSQMCLNQQPHCRSINFEKKNTRSRCQMNNQTRATKADELVLDTVFNYYEPIPVRSALYPSPSAVNIVFEGIYMVKNVRTKRLMFSRGSTVVDRGTEGGTNIGNGILGSDANYYNRAFWKILNYGQGKYLFENHETRRYLFSEGEKLPGDRGCKGVTAEAPPCLGSDANYDNRAVWKIIHQGEGKYLIESVVNFRYVFSYGEPPIRDEGGWSGSPKCVMADGNYENRALWEIIRN